MSGYKQSEVGVVPDDWEVRPLGEISAIHDGTHQTPRYVHSGVPFYSVEHVTSGNFRDTKFISFEEHRFLTRSYKIERGDILMTRIGSIGECKFVDWDVDASFYVSLALLKVRGVSPNFIAQYSNSRAFKQQVELHSLASAIPKKINLGPISEVLIALPPTTSEQSAIATALGDVDSLLAVQDALIAKKRAIKQGVMQELLTGKRRLPGFSGEWGQIALGCLAEIVMGQSPSSRSYNTTGVGLPLIQGNADVVDRMTISRVFTTASPKKGARGDILLSVRAPVGEVCSASSDICLGRGVCAIQPKCVDKNFLYHALIALEPLWGRLSSGSTFDSVNSEEIRRFSLLVPREIAEQAAVAAVLSDMDAELAELQGKREKTALLKLGMMQALLTGRTRLM